MNFTSVIYCSRISRNSPLHWQVVRLRAMEDTVGSEEHAVRFDNVETNASEYNQECTDYNTRAIAEEREGYEFSTFCDMISPPPPDDPPLDDIDLQSALTDAEDDVTSEEQDILSDQDSDTEDLKAFGDISSIYTVMGGSDKSSIYKVTWNKYNLEGLVPKTWHDSDGEEEEEEFPGFVTTEHDNGLQICGFVRSATARRFNHLPQELKIHHDDVIMRVNGKTVRDGLKAMLNALYKKPTVRMTFQRPPCKPAPASLLVKCPNNPKLSGTYNLIPGKLKNYYPYWEKDGGGAKLVLYSSAYGNWIINQGSVAIL